MSNLFLVPATRQNIERTISRAVSWDTVQCYLPNHYIRLQGIFDSEPVHCWAVSKGKRAAWDAMRRGGQNVALFTIKGTGLFNYYAPIVYTVQSIHLGNHLWSIVGQDPWEYIYFLKDIVKINQNKQALVQTLGYTPKFVVQGTTRVTDTHMNQLRKHYGSIDGLLEAIK